MNIYIIASIYIQYVKGFDRFFHMQEADSSTGRKCILSPPLKNDYTFYWPRLIHHLSACCMSSQIRENGDPSTSLQSLPSSVSFRKVPMGVSSSPCPPYRHLDIEVGKVLR